MVQTFSVNGRYLRMGWGPAAICTESSTQNSPHAYAGDHGDIDLAKALQMSAGNDNIALVTFGHMHQQLQDASAPSERRWTKEQRNMVDICPTTGWTTASHSLVWCVISQMLVWPSQVLLMQTSAFAKFELMKHNGWKAAASLSYLAKRAVVAC